MRERLDQLASDAASQVAAAGAEDAVAEENQRQRFPFIDLRRNDHREGAVQMVILQDCGAVSTSLDGIGPVQERRNLEASLDLNGDIFVRVVKDAVDPVADLVFRCVAQGLVTHRQDSAEYVLLARDHEIEGQKETVTGITLVGEELEVVLVTGA